MLSAALDRSRHWHAPVLDARNEFRAHVHAWQDFDAELRTDDQAMLDQALVEPTPAVRGTWFAAKAALDDAVPLREPFGLRDRLTRALPGPWGHLRGGQISSS